FAAYIEVGRSVKEPKAFMENNYGGAKNLVEIIVKKGVNKFLYSSTAAVYGNPEHLPISETAKLNPVSPYGESKVKVEKLLGKYADKGKLDSIRLRYFNPAGSMDGKIGEKHEPETHLIPLILKSAKGERDKLYIFGNDYETKDGTPIRDYIHVMDLVEAHIYALKHLEDMNGTDVFNVGTGTGYTVKEVFETTKEITGLDIPYEIVERRKGDSKELVADPTKIEAVLGWKAQYNLRDIIQSAWDFEKTR
ncbi:UDP-glucose 4-epimerase GalE, partial [Candidatus Dojkabacteria bacterium]|nr:UDP-glucose 4-epimerase GalE [Candidatus Dojkabacteria bacterium]